MSGCVLFQVAEREGLYLAKTFSTSGEVKPFAFKSAGMLAYIGGFEGLSDLPDVKLRGQWDIILMAGLW